MQQRIDRCVADMLQYPRCRKEGNKQFTKNAERMEDGKDRHDTATMARGAGLAGGGADRALEEPHLARAQGPAQAGTRTRRRAARHGLQGGGGVIWTSTR